MSGHLGGGITVEDAEELTSLLSLLQTLSNGLGSIAGAESKNQGRRKRESGAKHIIVSHIAYFTMVTCHQTSFVISLQIVPIVRQMLLCPN